MTDEFDLFTKNIKSITSQEFNRAHSLIGTIVGYTNDMKYCDVEVRMKGGVHTFANVPAHGYPVKGSSGVIHFHDGNLQQPFCDCEYRMNPPDSVLITELTNKCNNYVNNGDFTFDGEGFTSEEGEGKLNLHEDGFTSNGKGCLLPEENSFIEFTVDLTECKSRYFKFQCYYRGLNYLKVECFNVKTGKVIQNLPESMSHDYRLWSSQFGRFKWAFNKEVYPFINEDLTLNNHIKIRLSNYRNPSNHSELTIRGDNGEPETVEGPHAMQVDGLLVFGENGDNKYYNSEQDVLKLHNLISEED